MYLEIKTGCHRRTAGAIVVPAPQERIKAIVASGGGFVYLMMGQQKMKRHSLISLMTLQSK